MTYYALLDYDGFVCKAYYAAVARDGGFDEAYDILKDLEDSALEKSCKFYGEDANIKVIKVMSGHSWKKDIYPTYKLGRKRNEELGIFRDMVKLYKKNELLIVPQLEADEVLIMYANQYPIDHIIFSDDKDLRYYSTFYCKINITEEIQQNENVNAKFIQLLTGDREDGITGIPKVGDKTAEKLLDMAGYTLESVIEMYKVKEIELDDCIKQLVLTIPMNPEWVSDYKFGFTDKITMNNILGQCRYISEKVMEVYNK